VPIAHEQLSSATCHPHSAPQADHSLSGFVYGSIVGSITELTRKGNMEGDIVDLQVAQARSIIRSKADVFLQAKILEVCLETHVDALTK